MLNSVFRHSLLFSLVAFTCAEQSLFATPRTMSIDVRHSEGGGVGYSQSYSSLDGFFALDKETYIPYIDARGHVFNDGRFAANVGLGARGVYDSSCLAIGGNVFYDYRDTHRKSYNQIGLGLEVLKPLWEIHVNGYFPVGSKKSHFFDRSVKDVSFSGGTTAAPTFDHFAGHNLFLSIPGRSSSSFVRIKKKKQDFAMAGVDADFNVHLVKAANINFEAGAGPYYYRGSYGKQAIGGKAKVTAKWSRYVAGEFAASYDNIFHGRIHGGLSLIYPFGPKLKKREQNNICTSHPDLFYDRLVQRADRAEIIVVDRKHFTSKQTIVIPGTATVIAVAVNPATGLPWNFIFVNNQSSSDGTFESPYPTLALAEMNSAQNDVIYVYPGDGRTFRYNTGFTMQDVQKLWGAGIAHNLSTTVGTVVVPALASSNPNIGNVLSSLPNEAAVVLANNNEIAGITFRDELTSGGPAYLVRGLNINNALIQENTFYLQNNDIGTYIDNTLGSTALGQIDILDNDMSIFNHSSSYEGLVVYGGNGVVNITGNTLDSSAGTGISYAIDVETYYGNTALTVSQNTINDVTIDGVYIDSYSNSVLNATLVDNTIVNTPTAFYLEADDTSSLSAEINNNIVSNVIDEFSKGIYFYNDSTSTAYLAASGNQFNYVNDTQRAYPFFIKNFGGGTLNATISANTADISNQGNALYFSNSNGTATLTASGNTFSFSNPQSSSYGIYVESSTSTATDTTTATLLNNTVTNMLVPFYLFNESSALSGTGLDVRMCNNTMYVSTGGTGLSATNASPLTTFNLQVLGTNESPYKKASGVTGYSISNYYAAIFAIYPDEANFNMPGYNDFQNNNGTFTGTFTDLNNPVPCP